MRVLVAVADAGTLSEAARRLGRPLTTISRQLAGLEAELGASLIARTTRRHALTNAGRSYLDVARKVLDEIETAEGVIGAGSGEIAGELAITAPVVFGRLHVLPVLVEFLERYPRVDARLLLVDRTVDLTEEGLDVAVRIGALPDSALVASRVGALRLLTCA